MVQPAGGVGLSRHALPLQLGHRAGGDLRGARGAVLNLEQSARKAAEIMDGLRVRRQGHRRRGGRLPMGGRHQNRLGPGQGVAKRQQEPVG